MDSSSHAGKIAVVTGAGSGIGRAAALRLGREGAQVVGCDIVEPALGATKATLEQAGLTDQTWDRVMAVNVTGVMRLSRAVLPLMLDAGGGAIVTVASKASLGAGASGVAYTTSKHAVIGLVKSIACFYGPRGIRSNAVLARPGGDQHWSDRRPEGGLGGGAGATGTGNDGAAGTARRDCCGDLVARQRRCIQRERRNVGR